MALTAFGCDQAQIRHRPRRLSDDGLSYISGDLAEWHDAKGMPHVRRPPYHLQTQGKIERQKEEGYQTLKNLTPAEVCCGRGQEILEERRPIKRQALEHRPNRFHQNRTVSWLISMPRSHRRSLT